MGIRASAKCACSTTLEILLISFFLQFFFLFRFETVAISVMKYRKNDLSRQVHVSQEHRA